MWCVQNKLNSAHSLVSLKFLLLYLKKNIIGSERKNEQDVNDLLHQHVNITDLGIFKNTYYLILMSLFIFLV
jgi:hypothetical protein